MAHEARACDGALSRAFGFLGKRWNGVILGTLLNGQAGFADLKRAIPADPWGKAYGYGSPGEHTPNGYDLWTYGRDGQQGGEGDDADVTSW